VTVYGWDASHYDRNRFGKPLDLAAARAAGIVLFTHKATEGTTIRDAYLGESLTAARAAGIPVLGAYVVPRTAASVADTGARFLSYLDQAVPWWRTHPAFVLQVDTEIWSSHGVVYDAVSPVKGEQLCAWLRDHTDKFVIHYAPRWAYHDTIPGTTPLWSSSYGTNPTGSPAAVYPGDAGPGWTAYSGRVPLLWQFGSNTTIGPHHECDANAYRGTLAQLLTAVGGKLPPEDTVTTPVDLTYSPRPKPAPVGDRAAATLLADLWGQEILSGSPVDGAKSPRTQLLAEVHAATIPIADQHAQEMTAISALTTAVTELAVQIAATQQPTSLDPAVLAAIVQPLGLAIAGALIDGLGQLIAAKTPGPVVADGDATPTV
jgi:hypothetical protein